LLAKLESKKLSVEKLNKEMSKEEKHSLRDAAGVLYSTTDYPLK